MALTETEKGIQEFMLTELFYDKDLKEISPTESLIREGMLDSLAILRVVSFCEENYGVSVPDTDILPEHFENISAIAALVERLRGAK